MNVYANTLKRNSEPKQAALSAKIKHIRYLEARLYEDARVAQDTIWQTLKGIEQGK